MGKERKRKRQDVEAEEAHVQGGPDRGFRLLRYHITLPMAPVHSANIRAGVSEILDSWSTKYVPSLGIVLCTVTHETLQIAPTAPLVSPTAIAAVPVIFECIGWRPKIGSTLSARVITHTREHVSLLIHNAFNAKITSEHIPTDQYYFDPDRTAPAIPLGNLWQAEWKKLEREAEEATAQIEGLEIVSAMGETEREASIAPSNVEGHVGCWVQKDTEEPLGGEDGLIEFKVIGLTMLNATISVHGSLLENPFSKPAHVPHLPIPSTNTLQNTRTPIAQHPMGNKPIEQPSVSADSDDSEASDFNDEENGRPAIPELPTEIPPPSKSSKSKGKAKAIPDASHPDQVLAQADKDDSVLQDPEQLSHAVDMGMENSIPKVESKKKKKKRKDPAADDEPVGDASVVNPGMEVDSPHQPPKKKRKSEVAIDTEKQAEPSGMEIDGEEPAKKKKKKSKKSADAPTPIAPPAEASAAIDLSSLIGTSQKASTATQPLADKPVKAKKEKIVKGDKKKRDKHKA